MVSSSIRAPGSFSSLDFTAPVRTERGRGRQVRARQTARASERAREREVRARQRARASERARDSERGARCSRAQLAAGSAARKGKQRLAEEEKTAGLRLIHSRNARTRPVHCPRARGPRQRRRARAPRPRLPRVRRGPRRRVRARGQLSPTASRAAFLPAHLTTVLVAQP